MNKSSSAGDLVDRLGVVGDPEPDDIAKAQRAIVNYFADDRAAAVEILDMLDIRERVS